MTQITLACCFQVSGHFINRNDDPMPMLVQALGEFFDRKPKVIRIKNETWVVANDRGYGLHRAEKVNIIKMWGADQNKAEQ